MTSPDRGQTWDDADGPMVQPQRDDWEIGRRVRARIAAMTDNGRDQEAADVLATQGWRVSDRLLAEAQRGVLDSDSETAIRAYVAEHPAPTPAAATSATEQRRRERWAATRPRPDDFPGTGRERDEADYQQWRHHFWRHMGVDPDDAEHDAWLDSGYGIAADDMHYRSPDLDDLIPDQRDDHVQEHIR